LKSFSYKAQGNRKMASPRSVIVRSTVRKFLGGEHMNGKELATLGGGCFWCTEAIFSELRGVQKVESGYSGGTVPNPSYEQVCTGRTGHAEVVQVTFDPKVVSFKELLQIFLTIHDPTTLNRQGADVGTQYRSIIVYHNTEQKVTAAQVIKEIESAEVWDRPIVTEVKPFESFYRAEDYHQEYFKHNAGQAYCQIVIAPKVAKLRKQYRDRLKAAG
jgi:peptide-methionine (S)-S-oxide reductase